MPCSQSELRGARSATIRVPWAEPIARFTLAFEALANADLANARSTKQTCELLKIGCPCTLPILATVQK